MIDDFDIAIVGLGPAGSSAAWALRGLAPDLAKRTVALDMARHPRKKICAGCVTGRGWAQLEKLDLAVDVPHIPVSAVRFKTCLGDIDMPREGVGRIVRRSDFDHALVNRLKDANIAVHEGVRVAAVSREGDRVRLTCRRDGSKVDYLVKMAVGADGASSVVRKSFADPRRPVNLVMAHAPSGKTIGEDDYNRATFDLRWMVDGVRGYRWLFPALGDGEGRCFSFGACDFDGPRAKQLRKSVIDLMAENGVSPETARWRHFPFLPYSYRDTLGGEGWILTGEAAGSDPLLAEGISYAIEMGGFAAERVADAFHRNDFSMKNYTARFRRSRVGKEMAALSFMAWWFYSVWHKRFLKAALFDPALCAKGGQILAGELDPNMKEAGKIFARLMANFFKQTFAPSREIPR